MSEDAQLGRKFGALMTDYTAVIPCSRATQSQVGTTSWTSERAPLLIPLVPKG